MQAAIGGEPREVRLAAIGGGLPLERKFCTSQSFSHSWLPQRCDAHRNDAM